MKHTTEYACNYAVLRFLPYPETGEFVNLGVAVHCPATGFFTTAFEARKAQRVTGFFPELDRDAFKGARQAIAAELTRVGKTIAKEQNTELGRRIFRELVRTREAVFRFGEIRTILTDAPATLADRLFGQYVNRQFAQVREYHETVMAQRYYDALRQYRPDRVFRRGTIVGTAAYRVRIPITLDVTGANDAPFCAIKPLDLQRTEPTAVIEHGDAWIQRVRRLKAIGRLPERFIFAVRRPGLGICGDAAEQIVTELKSEGVVVIGAEETERLVKLAAD